MAARSELHPDVDASGEEMLTVDQLAERTGITVRTIRFYAGRGLIPPPVLRGRTGLYGPTHVARLGLVSELSALGFTLAAIESHLRALPAGAGAEELALRRALLTPWAEQAPETDAVIDGGELERRAGRALSATEIDALVGLGALERTDGGVRLRGPTSLHEGLALLGSGLPIELWTRAHRIVERHTSAMAEELMELFQAEVLQPYRDRGRPPAERGRLAAALQQLKPITIGGVVTAFGRAVNRTIRDRLGER
jgi:DNA-binding transcriptional MerR regulator